MIQARKKYMEIQLVCRNMTSMDYGEQREKAAMCEGNKRKMQPIKETS